MINSNNYYMINNLPIEILDNIWNLYWMDLFKENVIKIFDEFEKRIEKIILFTDFYFLTSHEKSHDFDHIFIDYLIVANNVIKYIDNNKSLFKFFKNKYKELYFITNEQKHIYEDKKILDELKYISLFIISRSGYMRYYTYNRFVTISTKFKNIDLK